MEHVLILLVITAELRHILLVHPAIGLLTVAIVIPHLHLFINLRHLAVQP